jgi:hypothetical protein
MAERKAAAKKIIADAGSFKVCECCDSIVSKRSMICGNCNNYRFDESKEKVIAMAKILSSRPPVSIVSYE